MNPNSLNPNRWSLFSEDELKEIALALNVSQNETLYWDLDISEQLDSQIEEELITRIKQELLTKGKS